MLIEIIQYGGKKLWYREKSTFLEWYTWGEIQVHEI